MDIYRDAWTGCIDFRRCPFLTRHSVYVFGSFCLLFSDLKFQFYQGIAVSLTDQTFSICMDTSLPLSPSFSSPPVLLDLFFSPFISLSIHVSLAFPPSLLELCKKKKSIRAEGDFIVLTALNLWDRNKDKKRRRKRKESSRKEWKENFDMLTFLSTPSYFPIHFSFHQVNNISYFISCFFIISPYSRA